MDKDLKKFVIVTYVFSWIIWIPNVLDSQNLIQLPEIYGLLSNLATFGPLVGVLLVKTRGESFFKNSWKGQFNRKWYLPTLLFFPILAAISYFLSLVLTNDDVPLSIDPVFLVLMFILGGPLGEEFGWRGFALPRLLENYDLFKSSIILGAIWSIWHLPLHFIEGSTQSFIPIWAFFLLNTTLSIVYSWIYINTNGNIKLMLLLHWAGNASAIIFPYWQVGKIGGVLPNLLLPTYGMLIGYLIHLIALFVIYKIYGASFKKDLLTD